MRKQRFPDRREKLTDTSTAGRRLSEISCSAEMRLSIQASPESTLSWMDYVKGQSGWVSRRGGAEQERDNYPWEQIIKEARPGVR